jgi:hypothetical protein
MTLEETVSFSSLLQKPVFLLPESIFLLIHLSLFGTVFL